MRDVCFTYSVARHRAQPIERSAPIPPVDGQYAGRRLLQLLETQLRWLHRRPGHGNRVLHYDHLVIAHLVAFFNPTVDSLRTLEGAFAEPRVRQRFKLPRIARSTVADAQRLFDPQLLQPEAAPQLQFTSVTPQTLWFR